MSGTITLGIASDLQLDAEIEAINSGGTSAAANTNYVFLITADLGLGNSVPAIDLPTGDTLTIQGDSADSATLTATLDGGGGRGFVVNSGQVTLTNLNLTAFRRRGGGAIDVAAGASVAASNVTINGSGGTSGPGGAVYVAQGGTLSLAGGSVGGGTRTGADGIDDKAATRSRCSTKPSPESSPTRPDSTSGPVSARS